MTYKILLVDDDPNILRGYQRHLRKQFDIDTALCGSEGLDAVRQRGPYAVIVSDMRMPGLDGVQFLSQVREIAPDSVRIMLTGNSDHQTAIDAVNKGQIFRFLNKPCPSETFAQSLAAGTQQYRLIHAERELLSKTLSGTVQLLGETLSIVNPKAFGHAANVRHLVCQIAEIVQMKDSWQVEVAAIVAHLGCVTVPETILEKVTNGLPLSHHELQTYQNHRTVGRDLIARIPRLESVAEVISYQSQRFDESENLRGKDHGEQMLLGGQILKVALDFDALRAMGKGDEPALAELHERSGMYDPRCLQALCAVVRSDYGVRQLAVSELQEGMVFDEDVLTRIENAVIVPKGVPVGPVLKERLMRLLESARGVSQPIRVRVATNLSSTTHDQGNAAPSAAASVLA